MLQPAGVAAIRGPGPTQLRLRFEIPRTADGEADVFRFEGGDGWFRFLRPKLHLELAEKVCP